MRKKALLAAMLTAGVCALLARDIRLSAAEARSGPLGVGDLVPAMEVRDLDGKQWSNRDFEGWIVVYTFADRRSNKRLQEAIRPAAKRVAEAYPDLKIAYMNFADLAAVPGVFRHVVNPILRYIDDRNTRDLREHYEQEGLPWNEEATPFIVVPDWEGDHLQAFGIRDAGHWVTFVTHEHRIRAVLDASTEDYAEAFFQAFREVVAARDSVPPGMP